MSQEPADTLAQQRQVGADVDLDSPPELCGKGLEGSLIVQCRRQPWDEEEADEGFRDRGAWCFEQLPEAQLGGPPHLSMSDSCSAPWTSPALDSLLPSRHLEQQGCRGALLTGTALRAMLALSMFTPGASSDNGSNPTSVRPGDAEAADDGTGFLEPADAEPEASDSPFSRLQRRFEFLTPVTKEASDEDTSASHKGRLLPGQVGASAAARIPPAPQPFPRFRAPGRLSWGFILRPRSIDHGADSPSLASRCISSRLPTPHSPGVPCPQGGRILNLGSLEAWLACCPSDLQAAVTSSVRADLEDLWAAAAESQDLRRRLEENEEDAGSLSWPSIEDTDESEELEEEDVPSASGPEIPTGELDEGHWQGEAETVCAAPLPPAPGCFQALPPTNSPWEAHQATIRNQAESGCCAFVEQEGGDGLRDQDCQAQELQGRMHGLQARLKALQDAAQRALASSHAPWASAASPLAPQLQSGHERTPPGAEHHIEGSNGGSNLSLPGRSTRDAGSFSHDWAGCRDHWKPQEGAKQPLTTQQETSSKSATMNPLFDSEPDSLCPQGPLRRRPGTPADPPMSLCSSQDLLLGQGYEGRNPR